MLEVIYSKRAEQDIFEIGYYLGERNPFASEQLLSKIYKSCDNLQNFPFIGQQCDEISIGIRYLVIGNYLVFYKVNNQMVRILRILHSARHLPEIL